MLIMMLIQIISNRAGIVLFDYFNDDRTVRLVCLFRNFILCVIPFQIFPVMFKLLFYLFYRIIMPDIFFQHKVQSLANTGCFYSFHVFSSILKNKSAAYTQLELR